MRINLWIFCVWVALTPLLYADIQKDQAWEPYISSQKKLQVAIHHLLGLRSPDLKPVLKTNQKLQLALLEMKRLEFYYIDTKYPGRIKRNEGFESFVKVDVVQPEQANLKKENKDYRQLVNETAKLLKKRGQDPLWPEVDNALLRLENDREYLSIKARFRFVGKEIDEMLSASSDDVNQAGAIEIGE